MNTEKKSREESARDHAWRVFEARNRAFRVIYDTVIDVEGAGADETFSLLCRNLLRISNGFCAALASYQRDDRRMVLESVWRRDDAAGEIEVRPGIETAIGEAVVDSFKQDQVLSCREHQGCLVRIFPDSPLKRFASHGGENCYRLSCVREGELIAGGMIQLPAGQKIQRKDMIDTYLNMAGMIIQRVYLIRDLKLERRQLLSIFDSIDEAVYVADPITYEVIFANRHLGKLLGKDPRGGLCYRELQGFDAPCGFCTNETILENKGQSYRWEHFNPKLKRHYMITDRIIKWPDGRDVRFELATDITERKGTEERFEKAAQVSTDLIYEWNMEDDSLKWFGDIDRALGYDPGEIEQTIDGWVQLVHPEDRDRLKDAVEHHRKSNKPIHEEYRIRNKDGTWSFWTDMGMPVLNTEGRPTRWIGGCKDITERKRLEEELIKSCKLESIGVLAGGIAHDFNNILAAILGNVSIARLEAREGTGLDRSLRALEKACSRAQALTQQLLTFSRGGAPVTESVRLEALLKESTQFVLHGSNTVCDFKIEKDLWPAAADPGQLNQVLNNLVLNADQAMPDGGMMELRAANIVLEDGEISLLAGGRYIKIELADRGAGIPSDILTRIFDPYFSTKEKGSGLGLSTAYSIIRKHGGELLAESLHGKGSTFSIYLPASAQGAVKTKDSEDKIVSGTGRVLLMDDDKEIREIGSKMLEALGYQVTTSADGNEAIARYADAHNQGNPFRAVIFDLTVKGGMGGVEALARIKRIDPEVKAIVSSGYSMDGVMADYEKSGFVAVIPKPYRIEKLSRVLAEAIEKDLREKNGDGH